MISGGPFQPLPFCDSPLRASSLGALSPEVSARRALRPGSNRPAHEGPNPARQRWPDSTAPSCSCSSQQSCQAPAESSPSPKVCSEPDTLKSRFGSAFAEACGLQEAPGPQLTPQQQHRSTPAFTRWAQPASSTALWAPPGPRAGDALSPGSASRPLIQILFWNSSEDGRWTPQPLQALALSFCSLFSIPHQQAATSLLRPGLCSPGELRELPPRPLAPQAGVTALSHMP